MKEQLKIGGGGGNGQDITPNSILVEAGTAAAPSVAIGAAGTGIFSKSANNLNFAPDGAERWYMSNTFFGGSASTAALLKAGAPTGTSPGHTYGGDPDTGWTRVGADQPGVVAGGVLAQSWVENGGVLSLSQITAGITADVGSSQGDGPITSSINQNKKLFPMF